MKILVLCDEGNNRSVHFAHLLKYWNNDVIPAGFNTNSKETLEMLYRWADTIILTEGTQRIMIPDEFLDKVKVFDVGPDTYHRPFNHDLHIQVKQYLADNKDFLSSVI